MSASSSGVCKIWDAKTGKASTKLSAHKGGAFWATYNEAGDYMATAGTDKIVYVWSRKKASKPLLKLVGNKAKVRSVCFFNKDRNIISTSLGGDITIYDAKTGDILCQQQCLGEMDEFLGNIAYSVKALKKTGGGLQFFTTHQD